MIYNILCPYEPTLSSEGKQGVLKVTRWGIPKPIQASTPLMTTSIRM